jgi:hypothetical protein
LLDYEEADDAEPQMELALLAEGLHEMLMKGYGDAIARALLSDRCDATHVKRKSAATAVTASSSSSIELVSSYKVLLHMSALLSDKCGVTYAVDLGVTAACHMRLVY